MQPKELINALSDNELFNQLSKKEPVFFLDYDGTLTPIVRRPEDALLSESMRSLIKELSRRCKVAIISGRDRKDVEKLVNVKGLIYAGSHGFDISGPKGMQMQNEQAENSLSVLDQAESELENRLDKIQGSQVERKKFSIAVHYRNAPENTVPEIKNIVDDVHNQFHSLRKRYGKKIIELQPDIPWDKGKAILWLMDQLNLDQDKFIPIYIGDDLTDEDAFGVLQDGGVSILVGNHGHKTKARFTLQNVAEVEEFFQKVKKLLT